MALLLNQFIQPKTMPETWGLLPKSQTNDELIEAAIVRLIAEHNNDETAHLGTGQSLQSHKASEIIDHVAASIVADKIKDREVRPSKLGMVYFGTIFESLDGFYKTAGVSLSGDIDEVLMTTLAVTNDSQSLFKLMLNRPAVFSWDKYREFETTIKVSSVSNIETRIQTGRPAPNQHFGFKILNNTLYGSVADGNETTEVNLMTISADTYYALKAVLTPGVKVEFFVGGVSKGTATTHLPSGITYTNYLFAALVKTLEDAVKVFKFSYFDIRQEI